MAHPDSQLFNKRPICFKNFLFVMNVEISMWACSDSRASQFLNFLDLKFYESVAATFFSLNRYCFGSVISQLRVDRMNFVDQQINLAVVRFYPYRKTISNAVPRALGMVRTAQVIGDITSHI